MWVNNGKELESQYGGKQNTKNNNEVKLGNFDYFESINNDKFMNKNTIDHFLQKSKNVQYKKKRVDELLIYLGTWNVAGLLFNENCQIFDWLCPMKNSRSPDIYVVGFQEIVDLNPKNIVFFSNTERVEFWKNMIFKNLCKIDK